MDSGPNKNIHEYLKNCYFSELFKGRFEKYVDTQFEENKEFNMDVEDGDIDYYVAQGFGIYLEEIQLPGGWETLVKSDGIYEYDVNVYFGGKRTDRAKNGYESWARVASRMKPYSPCMLKREYYRGPLRRHDDYGDSYSDEKDFDLFPNVVFFAKMKESFNRGKSLKTVFTCTGKEFPGYTQDRSLAIIMQHNLIPQVRVRHLRNDFDKYIETVPVVRAILQFLMKLPIEPCVGSGINFEEAFMQRLGRQWMVQRQAIQSALTCNHFYIIRGPPGTGKTTCIAEIAYFALMSDKRVLVCAETNQAVDNAMEKLLEMSAFDDLRTKFKGDFILRTGREDVVRIDGNKKYMANQRETVFPGIYKIMPREIVIERLRKARIIFSTLCSTYSENFKLASQKGGDEGNGETKLFDYVIIDESAMSNLPFTFMGASFARRLIFAGDHKQLQPIVVTPDEDLRESLHELLFLTDYYSDQQHTSHLQTQYRMNPLIAMASNLHMYDGTFRPYFTNKDISLANLRNTAYPGPTIDGRYLRRTDLLVWVDSKGPEYFDPINKSFFNGTEAMTVIALVKDLLRMNLRPIDIGIICAYKQQAELIKFFCKKQTENLPGFDFFNQVSTVDAYQGSEKEVIIYSTTRCNKRQHIGFLKDERRFNVAITRAKRLLAIVGNLRTFDTGEPNLVNRCIDIVRKHSRILTVPGIRGY